MANLSECSLGVAMVLVEEQRRRKSEERKRNEYGHPISMDSSKINLAVIAQKRNL